MLQVHLKQHTRQENLLIRAIMAKKIDKYSATLLTLPVVRPPLHFEGVFSPSEHLIHTVNTVTAQTWPFFGKRTKFELKLGCCF